MGGDCGPLSREKKVGKGVDSTQWGRHFRRPWRSLASSSLPSSAGYPQLLLRKQPRRPSNSETPAKRARSMRSRHVTNGRSWGGTTMKGVPSLNVDFRREVFLAQATSRRTYISGICGSLLFSQQEERGSGRKGRPE